MSKSGAKFMNQSSAFSRLVAVPLASVLNYTAIMAQDTSGGAGVLLASAEVEAKLGKGIFPPAQNRTHAARPLEKKTVARSSHPSRQTTAGNRTNNSGRSGNRNTNTGRTNQPTLDAEDYNQKGDEYFDAGQYDKAAASYEQALHLRAN